MKHNLTSGDWFLDPVQRDIAPRVGQIGYTRMHVKKIDEAARTIHFVCSTAEVDRYGEVVEPSAYKDSIDAFLMNPVFPAGHVYVGMNGEPTAIGRWTKIWITETSLEGIAQFDDDENELAKKYWNLYRKGNMRAVSVGFISRAWEMRPVEGEQRSVRVFTAVELIEISAVLIPACRAALMRAADFKAGTGGEDLNEGDDALTQRVTQTVENVLKEKLNASPGGSLCSLVQDVIEAMHSRGWTPLAFDDDIPARGRLDQDAALRSSEEFNHMLRRTLDRGRKA